MNNYYFQDKKISDFLEYMKDNWVGLVLLILVAFIVYIVDHVNRLNTVIYSGANVIQGFPSAIANVQKLTKRRTKK